MEEKTSLLSKLSKKLKKAGLIASAIVSVGLVAGCGNNNQNPSQEPEQHEQQEEQHTEHKDEHSNLLYTIKEEKKSMIDGLKNGTIKEDSLHAYSHPLHFFEGQGIDVNAIKIGTAFASTKSYMVENEPNNLYMFTYCTNGSSSYYNEYTLCYTLTDKEVEDYKLLHKTNRIEAVFMNDAISATRSPEILSSCKCDVSAHESLQKSLSGLSYTKKMLDTSSIDILLKDFNETDQTFNVLAYPKIGYSYPKLMTTSAKCGIYYLTRGRNSLSIKNDVFSGPTSYGGYLINENLYNTENPAEQAIDVTWYYTEYAWLVASNQLEIKKNRLN